MSMRTPRNMIILIILGFAVLLILILFASKWKPIETPYPSGNEVIWFVKHVACAAAMCIGEPNNDDICQSNEVIAVGEIYPNKTCRNFCDETKDQFGSARRCGAKYPINFTFKEDVVVDDNQLRKISHFYNDIIHIACFKCAGGGFVAIIKASIIDIAPIGFTSPSGKGEDAISFYGADKCAVGSSELAGSVWIEKETFRNVCTYDENKKLTYCSFKKGTTLYIWGEIGFEKKWKEGGWFDWFWGFGQGAKEFLGGHWIPGWERCGIWFGDVHQCPKIVILPSDKGSPSDCIG